MVIGLLTDTNNLKRKFSQMFYLARQNAYTYVVLNDIFRYVDDEEASTQTNLPVGESGKLSCINYISYIFRYVSFV